MVMGTEKDSLNRQYQYLKQEFKQNHVISISCISKSSICITTIITI